MKLKTLMISLGGAYNQMEPVCRTQSDWGIFTPYLNKCVQLDIPSRAVSVLAPQIWGQGS